MKKIIFVISALLISALGLKADIGFFNSIVLTNSITNITNNSAVANGSTSLIATDPDISERGFCWSVSTTPTTANSKVFENGAFRSGNFSMTMTNLAPGTSYYVRAFAIENGATYYGNQITVSVIPTLPQWGLISLGSLLALVGGWFVYKKMS